jgi:UDP-N-acetylmuramoyl-tripeptide--D-alanyl-D-alanine ligase
MSWTYPLEQIAAAAGGNATQPDLTVSGVCTDTRKLKPGQLFVALKGDNFDANDMLEEAYAKGAAAVVTTRNNAPGASIVCDDPLTALQSFASWHRSRFDIPVLGITGSVGKTTTKDFTATLLGSVFNVIKTPGNLNNAIGCPLSLLEIDEDTDFAVIEMGANHAGEIRDLCLLAKPTESVITMVGATHVEGFGGSIEDVATAKAEIAEGLGPDGTFYVNTDNPWCLQIARKFSGDKVYFGSGGQVRLEECISGPDGGMILDVAPVGRMRLPLPVPAQAASVLIAVAVGLRHGLTDFEVPLRQACLNAPRFRVAALGPLTVFDDSYNASPPSMRAALEALALHRNGRKFAALGDMFELGPMAESAHRELGVEAARQGVSALFTLGPHAELVADAARSAGLTDATAHESHESIARAVLERAQPGDALLVKGSRGMRMEGVIRNLESMLAPEGSTAA